MTRMMGILEVNLVRHDVRRMICRMKRKRMRRIPEGHDVHHDDHRMKRGIIPEVQKAEAKDDRRRKRRIIQHVQNANDDRSMKLRCQTEKVAGRMNEVEARSGRLN
mmetsp:Transcript_47941/g.77840  ORF Transcript_47941/g.77840 Transcript_47941/m.77840 type:complete len:106 (+) Transcript_47941:1001-1318(+)